MLVATNKTFDPTALWQATGERETVAAKGAVAPGSEKKKTGVDSILDVD